MPLNPTHLFPKEICTFQVLPQKSIAFSLLHILAKKCNLKVSKATEEFLFFMQSNKSLLEIMLFLVTLPMPLSTTKPGQGLGSLC